MNSPKVCGNCEWYIGGVCSSPGTFFRPGKVVFPARGGCGDWSAVTPLRDDKKLLVEVKPCSKCAHYSQAFAFPGFGRCDLRMTGVVDSNDTCGDWKAEEEPDVALHYSLYAECGGIIRDKMGGYDEREAE